MSESNLDFEMEKELDRLRSELATFSTGVSYIEQATALISLAKRANSSLEDASDGKLERLENSLVALVSSTNSAQTAATTLENVLYAFKALEIARRIEETKLQVLQGKAELAANLETSTTMLADKLEDISSKLLKFMDRSTAEVKNLQAQQAHHSTKLDLVEERVARRQKTQLIVLGLVAGLVLVTLALQATMLLR